MSETLHAASAITGAEPFRTDIRVEGEPPFDIVSDAPADAGGKALGPSPVSQLASALAACKSMTGMMYARRKEWPVRSIRVDVRHVQRDTNGRKTDAFECHIAIDGDLDDEQRRRVYEITAKCPVHKMLAAETPVDATLVD